MSTGNPDLPIGNPSANQGSTISGVRSISSADNSPPTGAKIAVATPIELAEPFHDKIHQRFGVGRTCGVRRVKRHIWTQFFFESFPFFMRATAEKPLWHLLRRNV
jgi:hypothetical protein